MAQRAQQKKEEKEQSPFAPTPPKLYKERLKQVQDFRAQLKVEMLRSIKDMKRKYDAQEKEEEKEQQEQPPFAPTPPKKNIILFTFK